MLLDYRDSVSALYTQADLKRLAGEVQGMDIERQVFRLKSIAIDSSVVQFDRGNDPRSRQGMDYSHIKAEGLTLHASGLLYSPDSIAAFISAASLKEQSGFELDKLQTNFVYTSHEARLDNLDLRTPHTILRDFVRVRYPSLTAFSKNPAGVNIDLSLRNSQVQLKDVLNFAPQLAKQELFRHPTDIVRVNTRVTGTLASMNVQQLQVSGIGSTVVDLSGTVRNPTDTKNFQANLQVKNISTTKKDLLALLPAGSLPSNISIPETLHLSGKLVGDLKEMNADIVLVSSSGTIILKGYIHPLTDIKNALYDLHVETQRLDVGYILQDPQNMGRLTGVFHAKGKGMDPHTANGSIEGTISDVTLKGYDYHHLLFNGAIAAQQIKATAAADDPNLRFHLDLHADITHKYPALQMVLNIDTVNAYALHLVDSVLTYHGNITADFASIDPDALDGKLIVANSILEKESRRIALDSIQLLAGANDSGRFVRISNEALALQLFGQYRLTQIGDVFQQSIDPYFSLKKDSAKKALEPYHFTVKATHTDKPVLRTLVPDLKKLSTVTFDAHFSNSDTLRLALNAPLVILGDNEINGLQLRANGDKGKLGINLSLARAKAGSLDIYSTTLAGQLANNKADFALNNKDSKGKDRYHLEGMLEYINQQYGFSLRPGNLLLNYDKWNVNDDNKIVVGKGDVDVHHFELSRNTEKLIINTAGKDPNDSLRVDFENFKIATLTSFVLGDSSRFNGNLQGNVSIRDLERKPAISSDLMINDFEAAKDTVGNISIKVNEAQPGVFMAAVGLSGHENDITIKGSYDTRPDVPAPVKLNADIKKLQLATMQGVTQGAITHASGYLQGNMAIAGDLSKPLIKGTLGFNAVKFNLAMLNSFFQVDSEQVAFDETGFNFDTFTIVDSSGNEAVVDGNVYTTDYRDYKFDLDLDANNFHALNSTKKNNKNYYGQLFFTSRISLKGTPAAPAVDGSLTINDKTNLTIVVPQKEPGVEERNGIVDFVSHNTQQTDSSTTNADSLMTAALAGMNISVNVEVKKEAQLNIVIDPDNGDMLTVKGEALLNAGVSPGGNTTLTGTYEISEGSYDLTFNTLHRKFSIQKGSTLTWKGAPTEAEADITAVYAIDAPPIDLLQQTSEGATSTLTTYRQKLPFQVKLNMTGPMLKPNITFDILLPEDRSYSVSGDEVAAINYKLEELRKEPSELNKQVFALLLLNRFVGENPFQSSAGGMTAASLARKSASALLADQLNQLAGNLIKGVDINFGVTSEDDYSTGEEVSRTDVNVALSKRLFNDRLTVTVGNNFEVEGPQQAGNQASAIAGSVAVDYRLSKDGRYMLRGYRKNGYQGVLEGYVVETGVGFIITLDYDHFKELFQKKKKEENGTRKKGKKKTPPPTAKND